MARAGEVASFGEQEAEEDEEYSGFVIELDAVVGFISILMPLFG